MGAILISCRNRDRALADYAEALKAAGWAGETRLLGPEDPPRPSPAALDRCAGLLLTGGLDIHPRHWDPAEPLHPAAEVDEARDGLEIPLVRAAWDQGIPIFGICRGEQVLNVALGGSLVQDIPSHFSCPGDRHQHGTSGNPGALHPVEVGPGSRLSAFVGPGPLPVNTRHHQAVRRVAPSLRACAWDPGTVAAEGPLVEAVEAVDPKRWVLGVQWHPENLVRREDAAGAAARALFRAFLQAAGP
ncbi:MAG: gamma-glutamyl-gamma-aminobutyrate hydrolase family protein [Acidobacteria bacterium]|nr:gamma-glutamyl-gamma-aminobutyrate hydrolase family protein [Acidobacteriota bacterium]